MTRVNGYQKPIVAVAMKVFVLDSLFLLATVGTQRSEALTGVLPPSFVS